jgi:hypothetical protein
MKHDVKPDFSALAIRQRTWLGRYLTESSPDAGDLPRGTFFPVA